MEFGESGIGEVELIGEERGFFEEELFCALVGGAGGEVFESVEEIVEAGADALGVGGGVIEGSGIGGAIDLFSEIGLGLGEGVFLGLEGGALRGLAGDGLIEKLVTDLGNAEGFYAVADGAELAIEGDAFTEDGALARILGIIDIGEVATGDLDARLLGGERMGCADETTD